MNNTKYIGVFLAFFCITHFGIGQDITAMKPVKGGALSPLYGLDSSKVWVDDFLLDVYPVTNEQYLDFVKNYPEWQKSNAKAIFANGNYLSEWQDDELLGSHMNPNSPVTNVSWFAAKAYCACQDKRLPSVDEWELAARASETNPNAENDSLFNQRIVESYETPNTSSKQVGSTYENYWGVYDMHGLVWEWTSDFNSVLISGESRRDGDADRNLFCAGAAISASNLRDYAAFMRYAFRGSIKANYSIKNLGFRCAKSN
ncbi:formylglycine-generating enzyme family protein [Algoriphagus chordae]|uniref:Formylglycine-generating enzyme required for sulfatase activity n=1 Tax=Algoriphagus chordae TaxID=237019 RepID=A0A2W7R4L8_9BACT|nr:formylglycine-generating enzyme family protein [Algoriphagus chordae]PZX55788.1 formylglycine-generating enzyme required for sulfatase activity [Algoriphagus chordae]